jgi:hypothetical protein
MPRNPSKAFFRMRYTLFPILLILAVTSSAYGKKMDIVKFTSETYPRNKDVSSVEILEKAPDRPFIKLAQLTMGNSKKSGATLQVKIREEAAKMGAHAVVFGDPVISFSGGTQYAPVIRPWGYYSPYYGGYGGAYVSARPVPYKVRRNTLTGVAIRYSDK